MKTYFIRSKFVNQGSHIFWKAQADGLHFFHIKLTSRAFEYWLYLKMSKVDAIKKAKANGKITTRQEVAMMRHQEHHSSPHIKHMLANMEHLTFSKAHKAAKAVAGN